MLTRQTAFLYSDKEGVGCFRDYQEYFEGGDVLYDSLRQQSP